MKKSLIFALAILVVLGGVFYFKSKEVKAPVKQDPTFAPSASFSCTDGTHFLAEFPILDSLKVSVDGKMIRTIPRVSGVGQSFADDSILYVFAGEEVTVTDKITDLKTTCTQPNDPNNSPVNFGDTGEGANEARGDSVLIVSESIVGKWQSNEDSKYVREFEIGGRVVDYYDGKMQGEGGFVIFTKTNAPKVSFALEDSVPYLQVNMAGSEGESDNFKILKLTPEELEVVYLGRGNTLTFKRVK